MAEAVKLLRSLLAHPLTRGLELDDPRIAARRRAIIASKPFLKAIYDEWYARLAAEVPPGPGGVLELGSGAGHLKEHLPEAISSELVPNEGVELAADAKALPVRSASLKALLLVDVLHHLPDVRGFFREAQRCLRPGGRVLLIEPWVSAWSRIVWGKLHHEPFDPGADSWGLPAGGPLTAANGALPWIIFERDRATFEREFPQLSVDRIDPFMPLRYLASGGVGLRALVPWASWPAFVALERVLAPASAQLATYAFIALTNTARR